MVLWFTVSRETNDKKQNVASLHRLVVFKLGAGEPELFIQKFIRIGKGGTPTRQSQKSASNTLDHIRTCLDFVVHTIH